MKQGKGVYYNGADIYLGNWVNDQRQGHGITATRKDGVTETYQLIYAADWSNDNYNVTYTGNWLNNAKDTTNADDATYYYTVDGIQYKYVGAFVAGAMTGKGKQYSGEGYATLVFDGDFNNNQYSEGKWYYELNNQQYRYEGKFVNGLQDDANATLYWTDAEGHEFKFVGAFSEGNQGEGQTYQWKDDQEDWVLIE